MTGTEDHQGDRLPHSMRLLDLTLPTPAENLALDEALLDEAEANPNAGEVLRLWEPAAPIVVIGRSSKIAEEVNLAACEEAGIPVLRRSSGGAAIVAGPGCMMYAVVLSFERRPELRAIDAAHQFVFSRLAAALNDLVPDVEFCGTSDLAVAGRKFSGNSLRVKRHHLLYHGTLLYDFALDLISTCLRTPPRQPDYRRHRPHRDFVSNIPTTARQLRLAVANTFQATHVQNQWPQELTAQLALARYSQQEWTHSR